MTAIISPCEQYRYRLEREIANNQDGCVTFIMCNPSTADANKDDPTIRRLIGFAKRWGYAHLIVVNLFAYRATNPRELKRVVDPVGPDNDLHIQDALDESDRLICAWGAIADQKREREVHEMIAQSSIPRAECLGLTKVGHPKHPLYVPYLQQPFTYYGANHD